MNVASAEVWVYLVFALLLGAALGWAAAMRVSRANFVAQMRATADELEQRQAAAASQLRIVQLRAQNELERARLTFKRQLANAADGPRIAIIEAEERLRAVYRELDRLRRAPAPRISSRLSRFGRLEEEEASDGFASTLTMPD